MSKEEMGRPRSFRSKAAHFVSDLTTVFLNPISDKPSKPSPPPPLSVSPLSLSLSRSKCFLGFFGFYDINGLVFCGI